MDKSKADTDKAKALEGALAQIDKQFGKGSVMRMGDTAGRDPIDVIPSGSLGLDLALGIGGIPRGRIIEVYGPESSGKTTLALHIVAEAQRLGGTCAFIDAEHALDPIYARKLGVDVDNLYLSQPDGGEQALEICDTMVRSGAMDVIVIDSVAALTPRAELEGEMGDSHVGLHARLMSQALRKITGAVHRSNTTLIFINQIRCVHEDSWIWSDRGQIRIGDVQVGQLVSTPSGMQPVLDFHRAGEIGGVELTPKYRPKLSIGFGHRQTMLMAGGEGLHEVLSDDLKVGGWLAYPTAPAGLSDVKGDTVSEAEALFLGMFFADGSCIRSGSRGGKAGTYTVSFTEVSDLRRGLVADALTALFDLDQIKTGPDWVRVGGVAAVDRVEAFGVGGPGPAKEIPESILRGTDRVVRAFLRGASFDTHGFGEEGFIWTFESEEQAQDTAVLLLRFGIFADLRARLDEGARNYLHLSAEDAVAYASRIGFAEAWKQAAMGALPSAQGARGKYDVVPREWAVRALDTAKVVRGVTSLPHYGALNQIRHKTHLNASRVRLKEFCAAAAAAGANSLTQDVDLLEAYRFSQIEAIEEVEFPAVDIEVPGGRFHVNGTVTHNTKIGVMFGNPETTTGGNALKFYASIRLDIRRTKPIKVGEQTTGNLTKVKVVKNKLAPPFRVVLFDIMYGEGISKLGELVDLGVTAGVVEKSGAWFSYGGQRIGQGRENAKVFLRENPQIAASLEAEVRDRAGTVAKTMLLSGGDDADE